MDLYFHPLSPNCRRCSIVAQEVGFDLNMKLVDVMKGEQQSPEYKKLNPNGLVPTLVDDGFVLWESQAIMKYLAEKKGSTSLWPQDARIRADINRWLDWNLAHFYNAVFIIAWENFAKPAFGIGDPDPGIVKYGTEMWHRFAPALDAHLEGRKFVVGDQFTLADIGLATSLQNAGLGKVPTGQYKQILRWFEGIKQRESWTATEPPPMG